MRFAVGHLAQRLAFGAWLVLVWVLLWGGFTLANVVGGVLAAVFLLVAVARPAHPDAGTVDDDQPVIRPLRVLSLAVWFSWKLVTANLKVARIALRPPERTGIRTAIVAVPLPGCPAGIVTLVANIITLTPGTLTMEVHEDPTLLYVHELTYTTRAAVEADVYEVERRVVAAFGSVNARRASDDRTVSTEDDITSGSSAGGSLGDGSDPTAEGGTGS